LQTLFEREGTADSIQKIKCNNNPSLSKNNGASYVPKTQILRGTRMNKYKTFVALKMAERMSKKDSGYFLFVFLILREVTGFCIEPQL
jgi:hypothetical protein